MTSTPDRFFIPRISTETRVVVGKDEARHMVRVLRMGVNDELTAFDGSGAECLCRIAEASARRLVVEVLERRAVSREPAVDVTLAIAASKNKAMDMIVRKCTELGLSRLIPFQSGRSVARIDDASKIDKWRRAAVEACKQCGRNLLPEILELHDLGGVLAAAAAYDLAVVAAENEQDVTLRQVLQRNAGAKTIMCVIGPEGGFEPAELAEITRAGVAAVSLGRSILRVETAAVAALAMIIYQYSE